MVKVIRIYLLMNDGLYSFISFPENYVSINQCITDFKKLGLKDLKKVIPVYNNLFIKNENNKLIVHPKYGSESDFFQLCSIFPQFSITLKINDLKDTIDLNKFSGFINSVFIIIPKDYNLSSILDYDEYPNLININTFFIYLDLPTNQEFDKIIDQINKEKNNEKKNKFKLIFPFYLLENANSIKKQINIMRVTEPLKMKIGFYPKEICQSFIDPRKYHLLFTLLSSLPHTLLFLNGQESLRNYPTALIPNSFKETINLIHNFSFFKWLCETRDILQHYRNMIQKYRCPTLNLKKKIIWLEYKSEINNHCFKIGFNFEKLFIKLNQSRIYHLKTIWYNEKGAHLDQSGIKKHLAPFGIAILDNFNK